MEYLKQNELTTALNDLKGIEEKANIFLSELYQNGNFTDNDILSFVENPKNVFLTVQKIGYEDANRFSISTQKELLRKQADQTAGRLKQLASNIFFGTTLNYSDIEQACYIDEGIFKIDEKKATEILKKQFTHVLTELQQDLFFKLNNVCTVLNSLNTYAEKSKIIRCIDIDINNNNLISGGLHPVFRERRPYEVNIDNVIKTVK